MAEHRIAHLELGHRRTNRLHVAGKFDAKASPSGSTESEEQPPELRIGPSDVRVALRDRARSDPNEDLVVLGHGSFNVVDAQHLRRTVPVLNDGFHCGRTVRPTPRHRARFRASRPRRRAAHWN